MADIDEQAVDLSRRRPAVAAPRGPGTAALSVVIWADTFPTLSETFIANEVRALARAGHRVRVEAAARPARPEAGARDLPVNYLEDDTRARRLADLGWLVARHPREVLGDLRARRRFAAQEGVRPLRHLAPAARRAARGEERHLHAHFAAAAALNAMRVSRLVGASYSLATHGFDIFQTPRNLVAKHAAAAFAVTGCEYSARHLRGLVGPPHAARIHKLVVGVDGERFRRRTPYPGRRRVLAVARLVEKKGLTHLVEAAAQVRLDAVQIVGDGPLRTALAEQIRRLGLTGVVELVGWQEPDAVRELFERADVLAAPCVVAADGDRDTMPVVVKEALAMEVPVVASDEVGLPEIVHPGWGRLVAPGDGAALAAGLEQVLSLPAAERAAMGRAGRRWVLEHCSLERETVRLAALMTGARG